MPFIPDPLAPKTAANDERGADTPTSSVTSDWGPGGYTLPFEQSIDDIISEASPDANRHHNLHNLHTLTSAYYKDLANKYHALGDKKSANEHESLSYQHGELAKTHKALFDVLSAKKNQ
jgi:hypothetical protein